MNGGTSARLAGWGAAGGGHCREMGQGVVSSAGGGCPDKSLRHARHGSGWNSADDSSAQQFRTRHSLGP